MNKFSKLVLCIAFMASILPSMPSSGMNQVLDRYQTDPEATPENREDIQNNR